MQDTEIKRMYEWMQERVQLADATDGIAITFNEPGPDEFQQAGFAAEAVDLTLSSDWWAEMVTDIIETPDFADPGESPQQVLQYARDVVKEYVAKRMFT